MTAPLIGLSLAMLIGGGHPYALGVASQEPEPLEKAFKHLQAEQWEQALPELERAVERDPSNAEAYNLLGSVYANLGQHSSATEAFQKAIRAAPSVSASYNNLGISFLREGRPAEAAEAFRTVLKLEPDSVTAHYNLGWLLLRTGEPDQAIHHLERARGFQPHDVAVGFHLAQAYSDTGRLEPAREILANLAGTPEGFRVPEVQNLLGTVLARLGRTGEAIFFLRRAVELDATTPDHRYRLALAYQKERETDRAMESISQAVSLGGDSSPPEYFLTLGALHLDRKEVAQADLAFRQATDRAPDRGTTGMLAGLLFQEAGYNREALREFQQARSYSRSPELDFQIGLTCLLAGEPEQALAFLEPLHSEERFSKTPNFYRLLARAYWGAQRWTKSLEVLESVLEIVPEDLSLYFELGLTLVNLNALSAAEEYFRELLSRTEPSSSLYVGLAQALMLQDRYTEAREVLERAVGNDPDNPEAHYLLGNCFNETDRPAEAIESYWKAISRDSERDDFRVSLGIALEKTGDLAGARGIFEEALGLNPDSAEAHYRLGRLLAQTGEKEGALHHLQKAAELAPDDPQSHYQLGQLYAKLGEGEEARQAMETFQTLRRKALLAERKAAEALADVPVKSPEDYLRFLEKRP